MPQINFTEPPGIENQERFDRYMLEMHNRLFGHGEGTSGDLDSDNLVTPIPVADGGTGDTNDPYDRSNHTSTQLASTISDISTQFTTDHDNISGNHSALKQAVDPTDESASTVSVDAADASDLATVITLANEMKADINTLTTDLNNAINKYNTLLANLRTGALIA